MKSIKYLLMFVLIILLNVKCESDKNYFNPLISGEWTLIEVYGVKADHTLGWIIVQDTPVQKIKFDPDGSYAIYADDNITCNGNFTFKSDDKLILNPEGCMPILPVTETIYKLTSDSLIISNHSPVSSFNLREDKYIRYN